MTEISNDFEMVAWYFFTQTSNFYEFTRPIKYGEPWDLSSTYLLYTLLFNRYTRIFTLFVSPFSWISPNRIVHFGHVSFVKRTTMKQNVPIRWLWDIISHPIVRISIYANTNEIWCNMALTQMFTTTLALSANCNSRNDQRVASTFLHGIVHWISVVSVRTFICVYNKCFNNTTLLASFSK